MTGSLGDIYGPLQDDPVPAPATVPATPAYDATPPPVGTEENPSSTEGGDVAEILMMLRAMGAEIDLERFREMAVDPRGFKPHDTLTMQLPRRMKDVTSKLAKILSLQFDEMALAQIHRCMVTVLLGHLPEVVALLREAEQEARRQRMG